MTVNKKCELITCEQYIEDYGWAVTYGIAYKSMQKVLAVVEDISRDHDFVCNLAEKITKGDVADIHFRDIIEDALV